MGTLCVLPYENAFAGTAIGARVITEPDDSGEDSIGARSGRNIDGIEACVVRNYGVRSGLELENW